MQNTRQSADAVAKALGIGAGEVLIESTGVIGRQLKMEALLEGVPVLAESLGADAESALHAAVAITTTDLVSKSAALEVGLRTIFLSLRSSIPSLCIAILVILND